jgi:hypothetical protein
MKVKDQIERIRNTLNYAEEYAKEGEQMRAVYMLTDAIGETLDLIERMDSTPPQKDEA